MRWSLRFDRDAEAIFGHAIDQTPASEAVTDEVVRQVAPFAAESTPSIHYLYDLQERRLLYVSRALQTVLGYSQDEIENPDERFTPEALHPDDLQAIEEAVAKMRSAEDGEIVDSEYRVRHRNGDYRWLWSQNVVYARDDQGRAVQTVGTLVEITQRKVREESYRLLFLRHPNPMWVYDVESLRFLAVNIAAEQQYGYSRDEFLELTLADIRPAEDLPWLLEDVRRPGEQRAPVPARHLTKDGRELRVQVYAVDIPYMGKPARMATILDETEKLAAAEELQKASATMEAILQQSPVAIFSVDREAKVRGWNPAASAIFGLPADRAVGMELRRLLGGRSAALAHVQGSLLAGRPIDAYPVRYRRPHRDAAELNFSARPLDPSDPAKGTVVVVADVTAKNAAERQLKALNASLERRVQERTAEFEAANQELEAFCFSVAHDLRQPLRGIDGFSRAVLEDFADVLDEKGREMLVRVRRGTQRLGELIDALLALSRVTRAPLAREWVDVTELVCRSLNGLAELQPDREVEVSVEPGMRAYGDPVLIELLFDNLVENAWKFTSRTPEALIEVGTEVVEGSRLFRVRDNGAGFDMRYAAKLFQPFERLHTTEEFPGNGIGLATCRRVVTRHGGQIALIGSPGAGASAFFSLQEGPPN